MKTFRFLRSLCCLHLFHLVAAIATVHSQPTTVERALGRAHQLNLHQSPQWRRLIHYTPNSSADRVLSDQFYISKDGRTDPAQELTATIQAYFSPSPVNDLHARCRFPARYYWLSKFIDLPGYKFREPGCALLERWALFDELRSLSLFFIGGYFGNPASTFGHALFKLNTGTESSGTDLLDLTVSYGANVPKDENIARYIFKGIFGGYEATYTDRYFYAQDLVYSRTEYRDIWDYELELPAFERNLIILHLWELLGKSYNYYFLDRNCAFRLAEVLELALEEPFTDTYGIWYAPVELFFKLHTLNQQRIADKRSPIIREVRFSPSLHRALTTQLQSLKTTQRGALATIVRQGAQVLDREIQQLTDEDQQSLLDALLTYQQYQLVAKGAETSENDRRFRDQIMRERLLLPPSTTPPPSPTVLAPPTAGTSTGILGVSIGMDVAHDVYTRGHLAAYKQESIGRNSLEGGELGVLDVTLGFANDDELFFFDRADLINVKKLDLRADPLLNELGYSWTVRIGSERIRHESNEEYDVIGSAGAGKAYQLTDHVIVLGMAELGMHSVGTHARVRPTIALRFDTTSLKTLVFGGIENEEYKGEIAPVYGVQANLPLSNVSAFTVEGSNVQATRVAAGISWYF